MIYLAFPWVWFSLGIASGALLGLGFHKAEFMGGYGSWRRRLARLGHISFFGTGALVLAMVLTIRSNEFLDGAETIEASIKAMLIGIACLWLTIIGAVTMPLVCFLSAWRKPFRYGFVVPVLSLSGGVVGFTALLLFTL